MYCDKASLADCEEGLQVRTIIVVGEGCAPWRPRAEVVVAVVVLAVGQLGSSCRQLPRPSVEASQGSATHAVWYKRQVAAALGLRTRDTNDSLNGAGFGTA